MKMALVIAGVLMSPSFLGAGPLGFGGSTGIEFPLAHHDTFDTGVTAEVSWRKDPYEIRFHFSDMSIRQFAVLVSLKHFFSDEALRPYIEAGVGPVIVDPPQLGLAYGARPEAVIGADLGLNKHLSFNVALRYAAFFYFGDTDAGKFEANHSMTLVGGASLWF